MNLQPAFSQVANNYDSSFSATAVGSLQRQAVWSFLEKNISGFPRVLELNAGTGTDALWMAQRGWEVLATDISAKMLQVAADKFAAAGLQNMIKTQVCDLEEMEQIEAGTFDLIFSNFGGLNCLSPEKLAELWPVLRNKLNPGGRLVIVVMGRFCAWESLYFLLKGKPKTAFRRLSNGPVAAQLDHYTRVETWYYSASQLRKDLLKTFGNVLCLETKSIGLWLPPSYLNPFFSRRPKLLKALSLLENCCTGRLGSFASDHYLISMSLPAKTK
jgi:ubiquinone/menaquinone biosynthesis C-methylase UbiE